MELWISSTAQLKSGTVASTPLICSLKKEIRQDMFRLPAYSYNQDTTKMARLGPGPAQPHHCSHSCHHLLRRERARNYWWAKCILGWPVQGILGECTLPPWDEGVPRGRCQGGEKLAQLPCTSNELKQGVAVHTPLSQGDPYHKPDRKTSFIGSFCTSSRFYGSHNTHTLRRTEHFA